jgi:hypothetical protein
MKLPTLAVLVCSILAAAAGIDGKWISEFKMPAGKKGGEARGVQVTLNLKADGSRLTGSVTQAMGRRDRTLEIQDGKMEGSRFSFVTVQKTRKGENKLLWQGTLEGDELKGTRTREGGRRGIPFTARRG